MIRSINLTACFSKAWCPPGCRQIHTNSYLVSSAPPNFLPSSQPDGDTWQGTDESVRTFLLRRGGREERKGEKRRREGEKRTQKTRKQDVKTEMGHYFLPFPPPLVCRRLPPSTDLQNVPEHRPCSRTEEDGK